MQNNLLEATGIKARLAGENHLELMLFELIDPEHVFAINVFKVREMLQCPVFTRPPGVHEAIVGVVHIRGHQFIPVIDLNKVLFGQYTKVDKYTILLITEYSRSIQGFLVNRASEITSYSWSDIYPPPESMGSEHYLTGVINSAEHQMIELIDVERILSEIAPSAPISVKNTLSEVVKRRASEITVVIADDSATAREVTAEILQETGVNILTATDGLEALKLLKKRITSKEVCRQYILVTDEEMPEMDGYTLTRHCREDEILQDLYIILNTSISGILNEQIIKNVGCDSFVQKISSDLLSSLIVERVKDGTKED